MQPSENSNDWLSFASVDFLVAGDWAKQDGESLPQIAKTEALGK